MDGISMIVEPIAASLPASILLLGGVILFALSLFVGDDTPLSANAKSIFGFATLLILVLAAIGCVVATQIAGQSAEANGLFIFDASALQGSQIAILFGILITLLGWSDVRRKFAADHYGCLLMVLAGVCYAASAKDLISLFLSLELVSLPTTVLLGMTLTGRLSLEATLKYFVLAALSSALFLLGCSFLYGATGTTSLASSAVELGPDSILPIKMGLVLIIIGLGFRATAVPFHFYAPDVFAGASFSMTATMSVIPKLAAIAGLVRVLDVSWLQDSVRDTVVLVLLLLATATMVVGNVAALRQTCLRRLMAYSSISQSGYLLLGIAAVVVLSASSHLVFGYMLVYGTMTLGVFAATKSVEVHEEGKSSLQSINGLYWRNRWAAVSMTICVLGLVGLPFTGGFWTKFQVVAAALSTDRFNFLVAVIVMAVMSTVSAIYYFSLIGRIYSEPEADRVPPAIGTQTQLVYLGSMVLTLFWFFHG